MGNLYLALELLIVGMASVLMALLVVIGLGKLLIAVINKYFPESEDGKPSLPGVDEKHRRAIEKAIAMVTNGKSKVEKIEKL